MATMIPHNKRVQFFIKNHNGLVNKYITIALVDKIVEQCIKELVAAGKIRKAWGCR